MDEQQALLAALAHRRITVSDIAAMLGVTRKTAHKRLADGLTADDVITICKAIDVNPVEALVEMGFVTMADAMDFVDSDGELLATADEDRIFIELADRKLTTPQLLTLLGSRSQPASVDNLTEMRQKRTRHTMSELPDNVAANTSDEKGIPDIPSEAEESQDPGEDGFDPA